jgi:hypothetical protein
VDRGASRSGVEERSSGPLQGTRWTVSAATDRPRPRATAAFAPRRLKRHERRATGVAEGPCAASTPSTARREHHIQCTREHARTLASGADTDGQGKLISMGEAAPRTSMATRDWLRSSG